MLTKFLVLAVIVLGFMVVVNAPESSPSRTYTMNSKALRHALLCIHKHEGSWTDPNSPYYGGLQMDVGFQKTYGREYYTMWGTADHWPPYVQVAVAMRAYHTRGFWPWPNTARMCGLL